jgi:spectinomycin phosphotransferase
MYERPAGLTDAEVALALREGWLLDVMELDYAAVGFGGYHWTAVDAAGTRWFATASRVTDPTDIADLYATMEAARDLADAGLAFVVPPVRAANGEVVRQAGAGYAITVFPFIDGVPLTWRDVLSPADRLVVVHMLAALHTAASPRRPVPVRDLNPRSRVELERALSGRDGPWLGGAYREAVRALISDHADALMTALTAYDALVDEVAATSSPVLTHGELHPGNLIRQSGSFCLIDWDTAGLAPPERDLWSILSDTGAEGARYAELTDHQVSQAALDLYRQRWDIDEIGLTLADLKAAHHRDQDTEVGWAALVAAVRGLASASERV